MLPLTIIFLMLAVLSGVVGYGGAAVQFASVAQGLFVVFVVLFLISAVASATRDRPPA
jgi:uncharacterized membrane protein YtjA (UPF0391 family)